MLFRDTPLFNFCSLGGILLLRYVRGRLGHVLYTKSHQISHVWTEHTTAAHLLGDKRDFQGRFVIRHVTDVRLQESFGGSDVESVQAYLGITEI